MFQYSRFVLGLFGFLFAILLPGIAWAQATLTVITYNVESDVDTDPARVAEEIGKLAGGVDLWGLTEVESGAAANTFREAASGEARHSYILGSFGAGDRLAILYNTETLKSKGNWELTHVPGSRKPLVAHLRHMESRTEFLFVVNHFNRRDITRRQNQAESLRNWARGRRLPVILAGDFNFDVNPKNGRGNKAFEIFVQGNDIRWIEPRCLAAGNCPKTGTQCDRDYNSILDFIFLSGRSDDWGGHSEILLPERATCDRDRDGYSDHRPVQAMIEVR